MRRKVHEFLTLGNDDSKEMPDEIILKKSIPESAILSEKSFAKTWLNKKEDEAWKDL